MRVLATGLLLLVSLIAYGLTLERQVSAATRSSIRALDAQAASLDALVARYEAVPEIAALDERLARALEPGAGAPAVAHANAYLRDAAARAAVEAIYVLDPNGVAIAASNAGGPGSFVGQDYSFRPYFTAALSGAHGRFFGVGATTGRPGYFLSAPIRHGQRIVGVVVAKLGIDVFEASLRRAEGLMVVHDENGVIVLASNERFRYRTVDALSAPQRQAIEATRQYGTIPLVEMPDHPLAAAALDGAGDGPGWSAAFEPIRVSRPVASLGWSTTAWTSSVAAHAVAGLAALATALLGVAILAVRDLGRLRRERRRHLHQRDADIAVRIARITTELHQRVDEHERTARLLREATDAAVQSGKLMVMGQMAAGLSHELTQPLLAMKTYVSNTRLLNAQGRTDMVDRNVARIDDLVRRMERIVTQLRSHARKQSGTAEPVEVVRSLEVALELLQATRGPRPAVTSMDIVPRDLGVLAEPVRLEQIFLNLLRNAAEASPEHGHVGIRARAVGADVRIEVEDSGPGIAPAIMPRLFEPFFTTKAQGEGLGLGLAVSRMIVEQFGGRLEAHNSPNGGAIFRVTLPRAPTPAPDRDGHAP